MASGTINLNESKSTGGRIIAKIVWGATKDEPSNSSKNVTASIYVQKYNPDINLTVPTEGTWSYTLNINGNSISKKVSASVLKNWVLLGTHTVNSIDHNGDGTKSITISGSVSAPWGTTLQGHTSSGSGTATFDVIPRSSAITFAGDVTLGNKCDIRWIPASASFRYRLKFALGGWSYTTGAIHPNKTSAYTYSGYSIPIDVADQIPNSPTGEMTVTLYTYSNSGATTQIGTEESETFTVTVPTSEAPKVYMSLYPVHSLPENFVDVYVQGYSKVAADITAETEHNATILSYDMTVEGKTYGEREKYTSGFLTNPELIKVVGHAVDSRQYGGYVEQTIEVIPYASPKILDVSAKRCDVDGNLDDAGTYLQITAKRSYYPVVSNEQQRNFCQIRYRYKPESRSYYSGWVTILDGSDLSSDEVITPPLLEGKFSATTSYRVEVQVIDDVGNTAHSTILVPTDKVYWHRDGARNGFGIGKYNERENGIDSAWDIYMNGNKITGLADPVGDTDAVTLGFLRQFIEDYLKE